MSEQRKKPARRPAKGVQGGLRRFRETGHRMPETGQDSTRERSWMQQTLPNA